MSSKLTKFLPRARCTVEERELIKNKAEKAGMSLSEFQRRACCDAVVIVRESSVDRKFINQLLAVGNNLNQITHKIHIHNEYDREELNSVLGRIDTLLTELL